MQKLLIVDDRTLHFNVSHHFLTDSTLDEQKTSTQHALAYFFFFTLPKTLL